MDKSPKKTKAERKAAEAAELERHEALRAQREFEAFGAERERRPGILTVYEVWWCQQYQWLKDKGYLLRPRYAPEWVPSWEGLQCHPFDCEDGHISRYSHIIDATRMSDGLYISLKVVNKSVHPHEVEIGQYFMMEHLASDPKNHCIPFLDVLSVPNEEDKQILVMPLLLNFTMPRFDTVGEVVECLRQLFEGLLFMHNNHVAHRDCMSRNIMMDAKYLYPEPFHPVMPHMKRDFSGYVKHLTRTQRPPKYYLIDFGLSRRYDATEENPLEYPIFGGDKSVPEFQKNANVPMNPFPTDIYYLGNTIRQEFLYTKKGLEFLKPLADDMVQDDPNGRPTMEAVVERFDLISQKLSSWKLRSRVVSREDGLLENMYYGTTHWRRRIVFIVRRVSAIPRPSN
ncbi:kinase-like domain-containing protein [Suillus clintonianus]|uniref:kinase-like domain-containing protein n=1 Tax=Suillus clintonianus TaxID=1904413 RepID=UPI001B863B6B|nr:kinase-like domain-containing protein [Suillus clintonianus]KAG2129474.1 kinase-like domain-containing protein [Suillus clintonianus]